MSDSEIDPSYESDPSEILSPRSSITSSTPFPPIPHVLYVPPILEGTTFLQGYPATTGFDSMSSHSFVSEGFLDSIGMHSHAVRERLTIATPAGTLVILNRETEGVVTLTMGARYMSFNVPLKVMTTRDHDLILGMDWMLASKAMVDMEDRRISVWTANSGRDWFKIE